MGITFDRGNRELYVANLFSWNVSVISDSTNRVSKTIQVHSWPGNIFVLSSNALSYDGRTGLVYLANGEFDNISVISGTTDTIVASIPLGYSPMGILVAGGKDNVYVSVDFNTFNKVLAFNGTSDSLVATISVGTFPEGIGYDGANGELYVVNGQTDNVSVISAASNTVVATISLQALPPNAPAFDWLSWALMAAGALTLAVVSSLVFMRWRGSPKSSPPPAVLPPPPE